MKAPTEKHLENWIVAHLEQFGEPFDADSVPDFVEIGFFHPSEDEIIIPDADRFIGRQVRVRHGIIDLLAKSPEGIRVIELKKDAITLEAIAQCARYIHDIKQFCDHLRMSDRPEAMDPRRWFGLWDEVFNSPMVDGLVVGYSLPDKNIMAMAALCNINLMTYEYAPDGEYTFTFHYVKDHSLNSLSGGLSDNDQTTIRNTVHEVLRDRLRFSRGGVE